MRMKNAALAAAAVLVLAVPLARAQQAPDSTSVLGQASALEQQRHQRIFGTTPDRNCIEGACSRMPTQTNGAKTPAPPPPTGSGQKTP